MDLHKGSPGVEDLHVGGNSCPPGAQASGTPDPGVHTGNAIPYGPEVSRGIGV